MCEKTFDLRHEQQHNTHLQNQHENQPKQNFTQPSAMVRPILNVNPACFAPLKIPHILGFL